MKVFSLFPLILWWLRLTTGQRTFESLLQLGLVNTIEQAIRPETPKQNAAYDFIVVGGGAAGCTLANRLSENPNWTVYLLEAGGVENIGHLTPVLAPYMQVTHSNWNYKSVPQKNSCFGMNNNVCALPRGKVLGGTSSINFMIYNRGNRRDFDRWAAAGNTGWSYDEVLPYFLKSENANLVGLEYSRYHNHSGPLSVEDVRFRTQIVDAFIEGSQQAGHARTDYNGESQLGTSYVQATLNNGRRHSAYRAFIEPVRHLRENLHILTFARVTRVLIDPTTKTAYGVEFLYKKKIYTVKARKEVILSAGAFNSPQLLMLSGIGPADNLNAIEIPILKELPVGVRMYDHMSHVGPTFITNTTGQTLFPNRVTPSDIFRYFVLKRPDTRLSSIGGVEALTFVKVPRSREPADLPDIELIFVSGGMASDEGTALKQGANIRDDVYNRLYRPLQLARQDHFTILPMLFHPKSVGRLWLHNKDPLIWPMIDPKYFSNQEDVEMMLEGIKEAIRIAQTPAMQRIGTRILDTPVPGCEKHQFGTDDFWRCSIRVLAYTLHHQVATCRMGPESDPTTVVNPQLKVHGIRKLRVVDTSIIPFPPTAHTNAPAFMIGEKAADLIRSEWTIETSGCCGSQKKRTIVGGWAWAWWCVTDVQRLSLNVMTLNPMCENVETAQGVPLTVTGVAQCKIMKSNSYKDYKQGANDEMMNVYYFHHQADELLGTASEQFLGKSVKEIKQTILQTLEGHLRAILGTLTVEEVYKDRDQFAALVREVAAPDVGRMGIEILSFTIKDIFDDVQYLASLGRAQTAVVKRDADAGVAEANRDAGIREAECEKGAMDVKYSTDTKIEDNTRMYKLQKANFDQEVNTAKAESQLAYELQAAKIRQKIRNEEIQIEVVERRKQIEIESQEVQRKELELMSLIKLPAESESYRVQTVAQGKQCQTIDAARAEAERIRKIGGAEAHAIELVGKAEAERMRMKAHVYKQYGDAAIMSIVLESLPKIAAEIAAPLAKTDEIVLIGGNDNISNDVSRLVAQLPPSINALTGVDLSKVLSKIPGAKA